MLFVHSRSADQQPASLIDAGGVTETYAYDADGAPVKRMQQSKTAAYFGMLYEEDLGTGDFNRFYQLNGQVVAMRKQDNAGARVVYLHSDHLGSLSAATSAGAL